jgi:hypothetical protein
VDIVITNDNFQTLVDVIIADSTYTNLVQCASTMIVHAMIIAVQDKA